MKSGYVLMVVLVLLVLVGIVGSGCMSTYPNFSTPVQYQSASSNLMVSGTVGIQDNRNVGDLTIIADSGNWSSNEFYYVRSWQDADGTVGTEVKWSIPLVK